MAQALAQAMASLLFQSVDGLGQAKMTSKLFVPLLTALLLGNGFALVSAPFAAPPAQAQGEGKSVWQTFTPSGGRFSILMPEPPVPLGTSFSVAGQEMQLQQFVASQQNDQVVYMAGWMDLPEGGVKPSEVERSLNSVREGFRNRLGGQLLQEFPLTLSGHPGRHFKLLAQVDNRPYLVTQRIYLRGDRLYQVTTMVPKNLEGNLQGSTSGFLKSFKFQ
jgi:hypothetical protein